MELFKGGTALRKFRAGNLGRFSTDLDFSAPDEALALDVLSAVDGAEVFGFRFAVERLGDDGRRGDIVVDSPLGRPNLGAKIEVSRHPLVLPPEQVAPVVLPIHRQYDFTLPKLPVVRAEEAIAEKLARFRRVSLARDLYDLQWFVAQGSLDTDLVRRLWVLKVYRDVNHDGRGEKPLTAEQVLRERTVEEFAREDIGYLTKPVALAVWIDTVRRRYQFLRDMTADGDGRRSATPATIGKSRKPWKRSVSHTAHPTSSRISGWAMECAGGVGEGASARLGAVLRAAPQNAE